MQTSTPQRARRAPGQSKATPAQFSNAAAKLIEQIQAEARAQLLEDLSAKDGITVLHGLEPETKRIHFEGDNLFIRDARGASIDLDRRRHEPESWRGVPHMAGVWNPAYWRGRQVLVDGRGMRWERSLDDLVCDDFGNLVEVPA